jgi:Spy/CpxP family protein refolding chaperone
MITASFSFGQPPKPNKAKKAEIQAQKVAFISTELGLTKEEAEKFWPIYNTYEDEMNQNRIAHRSILKKLKNFDQLGNEEAYNLSEKILQIEAQRTQIRKKYLIEFSKVLGKKKGAKVYYAEEKFKRELLKKIRKDGHHPPPEHN